MRIITGIAKGRKLIAPEGMDTRPTADRVKQSVFNIISLKLIQSSVLDLFAGTGNLGLEAISQGAKGCTFVENNKSTYNILLKNINELGFSDKSIVLKRDAIESLKQLQQKNTCFDIIFLDPPYSKGLVETAIYEIERFSMLSNDGIIISEYDINDPIPNKIGKISIYRTVKYGRTKISFWKWEDLNE